jgi:hypothetical protein
MTYAVVAMFVIAGVVGVVAGRAIFHGGWAKRKTHSCGWFEVHGFNLPSKGDPCPGCGKTNEDWKWRVGRPVPFSPVGWQWKDDNPTKSEI